ncbi:MAG: glycosyltransferase family 4 protein [Bacteroidales bacterium]|nr:glycosyltransferase family 4 protein [Bacteroidales bacterium]
MKKRILVLTNNIGGLYSFRKDVMAAIVDANCEVYISEPDDDERVKYFEGIGCHIIKTDFNRRGMNPMADFRLMLRYRKMIRQLKPVAVLTYTIKPNVYGGMACRLCRVPQLVNVTGLGDAMENGGWLRELTIMLYKIGIGKAKCVFFQNENNRAICIRLGIADKKSKLLPGSGVNLQYHVYQDYPADKGKVCFLFIARLLKDKGTEEYFEMAKVIKTRHPEAEFQILGWIEEDYQQQLYELVNEGVINYLGTTLDVRPYLKDVHCTVLPSYHEGLSNVNLESAANGRPVITTNVPGCRETVDDGQTGFLCEARSMESLTKAIELFFAMTWDEKRQMGLNGRKKIEREFDRQIVVNAYLSELNNIE